MRPPALLAALGLAACSPSGAGAGLEKGIQVMTDFRMAKASLGEVKWKLHAAEARLPEDSDRADLTEPRMRFYQDDAETSRMRSHTGELNTTTNKVVMLGAVVVESERDASTLETEVLHYDPDKDLFHTDAPVKITNPDGVMKGVGLEARSDLSELTVRKQRTVLE